MNDYTDTIAAPGASLMDAAKRLPGNTWPSIYLPKSIYEALPAAYMSVGTAFVLGAVYIGIGHGLTVAYMAVGLSCVFAGMRLAIIRRRARSK